MEKLVVYINLFLNVACKRWRMALEIFLTYLVYKYLNFKFDDVIYSEDIGN